MVQFLAIFDTYQLSILASDPESEETKSAVQTGVSCYIQDMSQKLLVANWKSNLNSAEIEQWMQAVSPFLSGHKAYQLVIAASFVYLPLLKNLAPYLELCVQTVSPFPNGAYTGAISAQQASEFARFALLGHAERRKYFAETNSIVANQTIQALDNHLTPIVAVDQHNWRTQLGQLNPEQLAKCYVMYEPPEAISSGSGDHMLKHTAQLNEVVKAAQAIQEEFRVIGVFYGGSVDSSNIAQFFAVPELSGCVVGGASLDPEEMKKMLHALG
jgi:triosephosphate isomerase